METQQNALNCLEKIFSRTEQDRSDRLLRKCLKPINNNGLVMPGHQKKSSMCEVILKTHLTYIAADFVLIQWTCIKRTTLGVITSICLEYNPRTPGGK